MSKRAMLPALWLVLLLAVAGAAQDTRPTLPPTWTPTFTPTVTDTPSPTPPPSITPTLTPAEACDTLTVLDGDRERLYIPYSGQLNLIFGTTLRGVTASFVAEHRLGGEGVLLADITRVSSNSITIPIAALPRHGLYEWRLQLLDENERVLCEETGLFIAGFPVTATPSPPPLILAPGATVVTATPQVIIVTATPTP